jgi:L-iditol 2-dehydrogenase/threonine 3-dehydrogenase
MMECYVIDRPGSLRRGAQARPSVGPGQVLIETEAVTICATDVAYWRGEATPPHWPIVPGHEYVGRIVESRAEGAEVSVGARVSYWGQTDFFGLAEYRLVSPVRCIGDEDRFYTERHFMDDRGAAVALIDESIPSHLAPLVEPLTAVLRLLHAHRPRSGERIVVLGAGTCGLLALQAVRTLGAAETLVLEVCSYRRQLALQCGAAAAYDPIADAGEIDELEHSTQGSRADLVIDLLPDVAGRAGACARAQAMRLLRPGGRYLIFGAPERPQPLDHWLVLAKGLSIHAAGFDIRQFPMWRTAEAMRAAAELIRSGDVDVAPLVTHVERFEDEPAVARAFQEHGREGRMKTAIRFN